MTFDRPAESRVELPVAAEADQLENALHRSQIGIPVVNLNGRMSKCDGRWCRLTIDFVKPKEGTPQMTRTRRARIALAAAAAGAALFASLPGTASAGILVASAPSCDNGANSQPFTAWGDDNNYFLAPG